MRSKSSSSACSTLTAASTTQAGASGSSRTARARAVLELPDAPACVVDAAVSVLHALLLLLDRMLDLAAHVSEGIQPKRRRGIHLLDHFWLLLAEEWLSASRRQIRTGPPELGIGPPQAAWRGAVERPSGGPSAPGRRCWRLGRDAPVAFFKLGAHSATLRPEFGGP